MYLASVHVSGANNSSTRYKVSNEKYKVTDNQSNRDSVVSIGDGNKFYISNLVYFYIYWLLLLAIVL
jgi:hypothetical protein